MERIIINAEGIDMLNKYFVLVDDRLKSKYFSVDRYTGNLRTVKKKLERSRSSESVRFFTYRCSDLLTAHENFVDRYRILLQLLSFPNNILHPLTLFCTCTK